MWVRRAAIRPIPGHARISEHVLEALERDLSHDLDSDAPQSSLFDAALERFEASQPALFAHLEEVLTKTKNEPALGFGYFLILAVFLAFERAFEDELMEVSAVALEGVLASLGLDEEIRMADPAEVVESDDVVAMEQPHLVAYVQDHVEAALEAHADDVDVDAVHQIYRAVLVEVLSLSYAIRPPVGAKSAELEA